MQYVTSCSAMVVVFVAGLLFFWAGFDGLQVHMHWGLALVAMVAIGLLRLYPAFPLLAFYGAHHVWGWLWWEAVLLALPSLIFITPALRGQWASIRRRATQQ